MKTKAANKLLGMAAKLGFDSSFMVEPLGLEGGLLLVWNKDRIKLRIVCHNTQTIDCDILNGVGATFRVSFAYVRPNHQAKELFWQSCKDYASSFKGSWVMLGDFKDIGSASEQWGSSEVNFVAINLFVEAYDECGLFNV